MLDQEAGTAQLKARHPLNCEQKKLHVVSIAAVACSGEISERSAVTPSHHAITNIINSGDYSFSA